MKYLLDTDVIVNQLRGRSKIKKEIFENGAAISIITFGELLYGAEKSANPDKSLKIVNEFINDLDIEILGLSQEVMKIYSKIKCSLEKKGARLDEFDLLIGSTALTHSMTIVTRNLTHFRRIPELRIEDVAINK